MRRARIFAIVGTLGLLVLHNNFWSWQADLTLLFGRVPVDLVYRLLWVVASVGVLWLALRGWWGTSE
ncbi:MAG: hypothetical protein ACE5IY_20535 [bacterium]